MMEHIRMSDPKPSFTPNEISLAAEAGAAQGMVCCLIIELMNLRLLHQEAVARIFDNAELVLAANATTGHGPDADTIYCAALLNAIKGMRRGVLSPAAEGEG
jgi:hypothetical protein